MKFRKIIAALLSAALINGALCSCTKSGTDKKTGSEITDSGSGESENGNNSDTSTPDYDVLKDTINKFYEARFSDSSDQIKHMIFPDKLSGSNNNILELLGINSVLDEALSYADYEYSIKDITSVVPIDQFLLDSMASKYDAFAATADFIKENNIESVDDLEKLDDEQREKLSEYFNGDLEETFSDPLKCSEGYTVNFTFSQDGTDGEDTIDLYYIDGEGWKVDLSLIRYLKKSYQFTSDKYADNTVRSINRAIDDMNANGKDLSSFTAIISTDPQKCSDPGDITNDILSAAEDSSDDDLFDFFAVITHGHCIYAADKNNENPFIGTYPSGRIPDGSFDSWIETKSDHTFDELYEICLDLLK